MSTRDRISTATPPQGATLLGTGVWPAAPGLTVARRPDGELIAHDGHAWHLLALVVDADLTGITVRCPHRTDHARPELDHHHFHGRAESSGELVGDRAGHGGCPGYLVADLHNLQQRFDSGERWPAMKVRLGRRHH